MLSVINTPTYAKIWDVEHPDWYWTNFYGANLTTPAENMARTENNRLFLPRPIHTSYGRTQHGEASSTRADDMRMVYDNILTYNNTWNGVHNFEAMGGTSATTSRWENLSGSRNYFFPDYNNVIWGINGGNKGGLRGQSQGYAEWAIMSYLGRVSYNYDGDQNNQQYPLRIYEDAAASKYVAGSAWHNYGGDVSELDDIVSAYPDKEIYFTEASIGEWNYKFEDCLVNDFSSIFIGTLSRMGKGVTRDTVSVSVKRPDFSSLTLHVGGSEYTMTKTDPDGYRYSVTDTFPAEADATITTPPVNDEGEVITLGWDGSAIAVDGDPIPFSQKSAGVYTISVDLKTL